MKKYLLILGVCVAVAFSACRKIVQSPFNADQQAVYDDKAIQDYFLLNQITDVTKDPSGLYYHIDTLGTGTHPTSTSRVVVKYKVTLLDETVVEDQPSYYFDLSTLIEAWKIGLPKIGINGVITMYVPSGLAYGPNGSNNSKIPIPGNTPVKFVIKLQSFN